MPRILTGIKPTGRPHLGNLLGAIRPALRLATGEAQAWYFIADYHALTTVQSRDELAHMTREVAATWLAMGLDPEKVVFYRQSDVPQIFELAWIFSCFTSKGWMNKAHAYKAAVAANEAAGQEDLDAGITMGLYNYAILMAADIVAFDVDFVPVGKDQVQHIEIARDIVQRFNHTYRDEVLRAPAAKVEETAAVLPGTDGRKMSKSYGNTVPLFATSKELRKIIMRIVTDSTEPGAPKDPESSTIFQMYRSVATPEETAGMAERYRGGIAWGEAKQALFERLEAELAEPRQRYDALMADPARIDAILDAGGRRARETATTVLERVRRTVGVGAFARTM